MIETNVDYKTMAGDARLVLIGESMHNVAAYKFEAIKAVKQLKQAGFTHFAIEMLPKKMQEKIAFYQRTGQGFAAIQQYFDNNWTMGHLVPHSYGELVKAAQEVGLKIVALDMSVDQMELLDKKCNYDQAEAGDCTDTHTKRNIDWSENIDSILKESKSHRVVAFMHRWHAVTPQTFQPGLDTLMLKKGIIKIRFIDFTGGIYCYSENECMDSSDETTALKDKYFYRNHRKPYVDPKVKSFQVHLPTKRIDANGRLQW